MSLRVLIAQINHETNTFSPLPTPLSAFGPLLGDAARAAAGGRASPVGAFVAWAEARGHEVICPLLAHAYPSGPVADEVFETLLAPLVAALTGDIDLVLLDLHGAMVCDSYPDAEGELIRRLRAKRPDVPIGVALDLHANLSPAMVGQVQAICGYLTYPHTDMVETGARLCRLMERVLAGEQLAVDMIQLPILAHTLPMNTTKPGLLTDVIAQARQMVHRGAALDISIFGGFPASDIPDAGVSVLSVGGGAVLPELARQLWARRAELIYDQQPLEVSLDQVQAAMGQGVVLVLDHGDNCMSGGSCDVMDVFEGLLARGISGVLTGPLRDPAAVAAAYGAGVGGDLTLTLGTGTVPLAVRVRALGTGEYRVTGPIYTGQICQMGRTALLETDQALIVVSEQAHEPWDLAVFTSLGVDPRAWPVILLKSRMYCRPVFEPLAKVVVEAAGGGVTGSDFSRFEFQHLRQPIYPLQPQMTWEVEDVRPAL